MPHRETTVLSGNFAPSTFYVASDREERGEKNAAAGDQSAKALSTSFCVRQLSGFGEGVTIRDG